MCSRGQRRWKLALQLVSPGEREAMPCGWQAWKSDVRKWHPATEIPQNSRGAHFVRSGAAPDHLGGDYAIALSLNV